jgi:hypothetical protein
MNLNFSKNLRKLKARGTLEPTPRPMISTLALHYRHFPSVPTCRPRNSEVVEHGILGVMATEQHHGGQVTISRDLGASVLEGAHSSNRSGNPKWPKWVRL